MVLRDLHASAVPIAPPVPPRWRSLPPVELRPRPVELAPPCRPDYSGVLDRATRAGRLFARLLELAPGLITWFIISALFWAALLLPRALAMGVLAFDLFWVYVSFGTTWNAAMTLRRARLAEQVNWRREHQIAEAFGRTFAGWGDIFHIVIIPNFQEPEGVLRRTLTSIADQQNAEQIIVVLAMEAREQGGGIKAQRLEDAFRGRFAGIFATFHPAGLPGEVVGKSSNENWAARIAKRHLVDEQGYDMRNLTVTSCDADTVFHPAYFACLSYKFATDPRRHRRFWQSPVLLTNNVWESPSPLRVGSMLSDIHMLGNLSKRNRIIFPQSTYSLSLQMAYDAGFWDPDVIPEDWHMFLKCFFTFSGQVEVEPIYLPTGNDAVRAQTTWRTFLESYRQKKRHAWGASDISYAVREMLAHNEMSRRRRIRRVVALSANHLMWTTNWWLLTVGWWLPAGLRHIAGVDADVGWMRFAGRGSLILCLIPYAVAIVLDSRFRPPKPAWWRPWHTVTAVLMWVSLPVTSFFFSTLPALEAQTRLMLGKRLEYRVTEKA